MRKGTKLGDTDLDRAYETFQSDKQWSPAIFSVDNSEELKTIPKPATYIENEQCLMWLPIVDFKS